MQSAISEILELFADYLCAIPGRIAKWLYHWTYSSNYLHQLKKQLNLLSQGTPTTSGVVQFTKSIEEGPQTHKRRVNSGKCEVFDLNVNSMLRLLFIAYHGMNFARYLAKLSEYMEQVNNYCPQIE